MGIESNESADMQTAGAQREKKTFISYMQDLLADANELKSMKEEINGDYSVEDLKAWQDRLDKSETLLQFLPNAVGNVDKAFEAFWDAIGDVKEKDRNLHHPLSQPDASVRSVIVTRDQAVWERETLQVEVPNDIHDNDLLEFVKNQLEQDKYIEIGQTCILDSVIEGFDSVIKIKDSSPELEQANKINLMLIQANLHELSAKGITACENGVWRLAPSGAR